MKVFPSFLQLHGKTYDYKIPYTSVLRLFLLPHKDQRFMFFVVSFIIWVDKLQGHCSLLEHFVMFVSLRNFLNNSFWKEGPVSSKIK